MGSKFQSTDLRQEGADAVVVAVTAGAVFESGAAAGGDEVYKVGPAFPLLQALRRVNERLLEENPAESLLFDVILVTTDRGQQQQSSRIVSSTRHYGVEGCRFCFSSAEDFVEGLLVNSVRLFLSTDADELSRASQEGVLTALLDHNMASCPSEQLRVLFCGDAVPSDIGPTPGSRQAAQSFSARLGEMRQRFGACNSPLSMVLVTARGDRERCCAALLTLRSRGVVVDEVYCLAGAPRGPILSLTRHHFLLSAALCDLEE